MLPPPPGTAGVFLRVADRHLQRNSVVSALDWTVSHPPGAFVSVKGGRKLAELDTCQLGCHGQHGPGHLSCHGHTARALKEPRKGLLIGQPPCFLLQLLSMAPMRM